jgi:CHAT domain-containing protein
LQDELSSINLPHIYWCASGPLAFLPLHAAGDYSKIGPEYRSYNYATASYIPTIKSLLRDTPPTDDAFQGVLAVSESSTLPGTTQEINVLVGQLGAEMVMHLKDASATKNAVREKMLEFSWIHIACHGIQDRSDPLESAFILHDGDKLTLADLVKSSSQSGGLAFLSACQTATGHDALPDEAIHLAGGMLSAGYCSVIGTMWSIQDDDAPLVAKEVYSRVVDPVKGTCDVLKSAWALHEATARLRDKVGEKNFVQWVPFIHMGV